MPPTTPKFTGAIPGRHLGRRRPTEEMKRRLVPLAPFVKRMGATPPPDSVDYSQAAARSLATMLGNDQYGDCTIAAALHQVGVHTAVQPGGTERVPTEPEAVKQYVQICGPGDQGCYIPEVLDYQRDRGMTAQGKVVKSDGYVSLTLADQLLAKVAVYLFGGLHLGVNLPREWYQHASPGFVWGVTTSDIVGGHSITVVGYTPEGVKVSTWGVVGLLTWEAFADSRWIEEIYATLSPDWYNAHGLDTHGINVESLKHALEVVRGGGTPEIPDGPNPPPPPPPPPPVPGGGTVTLSGTVNLFGQMLPVALSGKFDPTAHVQTVNTWAVLADLAAIYTDVRAKNWTALATDVAKLLADLGVQVSAEDRSAITRALTGYDAVRWVGKDSESSGSD